MKKPVIVAIGILAIAPLYCGAIWLSAALAQQRANQLLQRVTEQSKDMLKVVSRKQQVHFFSASEDITFAINNPAINLLLSGLQETGDLKIVIHNDVEFGPLPGFHGVGMARIESSLVLTPEQRKKLIDAIGTDKPLQFFTTLGYFGNAHFDIVSTPFEFHPNNQEARGSWKGGNVRFDFSRNLDAASFTGSAPGLVVNGKNESVLHVDEITLSGTLQRKFEVLFTGNETFGVSNISFADPSNSDSTFSAKNITYGIRSTADDQFINFGVIADSGAVVYKNTNLKEGHFDFATNHLDAKAVASMYKTFQELQTKRLNQSQNGAVDNSAVDSEDIKNKSAKDLLAILQHSPVLALDNIGFSTPDGALKITGNATINDVIETDITPELQYQSLAKKIHAQADIGIDQSLIDHWPMPDNAAQLKQQVSALESQGLLIRRGNKLESHIEYKDGKITANGKQVGG